MESRNPLEEFHPVVRAWFAGAYGNPSPPQLLGWPSISQGNNTLILAPTGSGKTLAAFLWAINHLVEQHLREDIPPGVRILYVSPLKALNNDIERNLELPLKGIREEADHAGMRLPIIRTAVRTGDTPQSRRAQMLKHPPDILITTPESLYLMLTAKLARRMFRTVQYVIVDEIHSLCGNKRGVHLSLSLERLQAVAEQELIRIGLSATQRPLEGIAAFLGGQTWTERPPSGTGPEATQRTGKFTLSPRAVTIVDAGRKKEMDLRVRCAVQDFSSLPQDGIWPLVFADLLEQIRRHRTTLIFVNNRRLAERVAARLNEMAASGSSTAHPAASSINLYAVPTPTPWSAELPSEGAVQEGIVDHSTELVQAYHGSMSRQSRQRMEEDLKAGKLKALVATSSLELGIDIGSIDLVIQLQSPKGIARGLQRVGRSGHLVTAASKGRLIPTHREDLVESAVVARAMLDHEIEATVIPEDCLDVLAQQIVAMVSVEPWHVDALFDLIRQSYCYRNLPRTLFDAVLRMLAGRYAREALRDLRPRISWDKVNDTLHALPGSSHLAITNAGTIADRGSFPVYLEDGKTRVGEVDEEFVFESRVGDTFILGTSVWRMIAIDAQRISVAPAPGEPARMPFWRGEGIGRSFDLGLRVGRFRREVSERIEDPDCLRWLQREFPIDARSAWNIQDYFRRQLQATGVVPHDRLIVVEGFRDEIGDPRIVVHSAFGRRVNGLLGLVLSHRLRTATGVEPEMLSNDDGVLLRCANRDALPLDLFNGLMLDEAQEVVLEGLLSSPMFGGQFRQNAARALLMPRVAPGKRTPLWLQRLRAADLLQIARQFDDFPIVIETIRDVLNDVLDLEHFKNLIRQIESGQIHVRAVLTDVPSPFCASLLFDFLAVYMYEWDQPKADRASQFLAVNREILSEVVDLATLPAMIRPEAIQAVEEQLQHVASGFKARSAEELLEILLRIGDLSEEEVLSRCATDGRALLEELRRTRRAVRIETHSGPRWIAGEEEQLYGHLESDRNISSVLGRYVRNRGPVTSSELATRFDLHPDTLSAIFQSWSTDASFVRGRFRPSDMQGAEEVQWCYKPNIERIHRQTIAILRKEIKPCSFGEFTRFLLSWHNLSPDRQLAGTDALEGCLGRLQGIPLPSEAWQRDILRRRIRNYSPEQLAQITRDGTVVWVGAGAGRMEALFRGEGGNFLPAASDKRADIFSEASRRILSYLEQHGASFFGDIRTGSRLSLRALTDGMAELFWAGIITNDLLSEVMNVKRGSRAPVDAPLEPVAMIAPRYNPRRAALMHSVRRAIKNVPGWSGRWSLVRQPGVMGEPLTEEDRARRQAHQLLERYGIVAREFHRREEFLPWALLARELQQMEMKGEIRRGYFVEGLSGMQYALPEAVEELRRLKSRPSLLDPPALVHSCDPANPFGQGIDIPSDGSGSVRFSRVQGTYIAFHAGTPVMLIENFGGRIWVSERATDEVVRDIMIQLIELTRLPEILLPLREIVIEHCNGERPAESRFGQLFRSLGFLRDRNQTLRYDGHQ